MSYSRGSKGSSKLITELDIDPIQTGKVSSYMYSQFIQFLCTVMVSKFTLCNIRT